MLEQSSQSSPNADTEAGPRRILAAGAVSVSWLVLLACAHVMYVGFVLYGSKPRTAAVLATLTQNGRQWYLPERELPIYFLGCALALVLSITAAYLWQRIACKRDQDDPGFTLRGCLLSLVMAALCSGFNLSWLLGIRLAGTLLHLPRNVIAVLLIMPAAAEIVLFYISQKQNAAGAPHTMLVQLETDLKGVADQIRHIESCNPEKKDPNSQKRNALHLLIDVCVLLFICLVIYVPRTDLLAGRDYQFQHFHHWDFFAMGPAIGLLKGRHLATQVYCQYGFGWPILLAKLNPVFRLSYGHAYQIAVIYGCIYYSGLYWLLRRLLPNPAWAIAGLMLALRLQVFHGERLEIPLWFIPSASILRTPCDIWVFLLLLTHWRTQRPIWLLIAGALVGVSLLFVIDTGLYLALVFAGYNLLWITSMARSASVETEADSAVCDKIRKFRYRMSLAAFSAAGLVLIAGLVVGSGSDVFTPGYIRQWLEVLWIYPSGISMLPMIQEIAGVVFSYWFILMFLAYITAGVIRFCYGRRPAEDIVVMCLAMLGLLYLIYYIGNSHAYSIFQLSTPFCIVVTYTAASTTTMLLGNGRFQPRHEQLAAGLAAVAATLVLFLNPQFLGYPNLLKSFFSPAPGDIVCYMPDLHDVCVAAELHPNIEPFQLVASEMMQLTNQGKMIAVIANDDTSLYVASRATLWNRYTPLLPPLMTQAMLAEVDRDLSKKPVDCVFLKRQDPSEDGFWAGLHSPVTTDSWMRLSDTTRRLYHFDHQCGPYEVWRR